MVLYFGSCLIAYLVGSIPTGYVITRLLTGKDIRTVGSGNIGATNVARVLGWPFFPIVFAIDAGKAYAVLKLAVLLFQQSHHGWAFLILSVAVLVGNAYSPFINFRGGKGVSTSLGLIAAMFSWGYTLQLVEILLVFAILIRSMAGASMALFTILPLWNWWFGGELISVLFFSFLSVWIALRHRPNIAAWWQSIG